MLKVFLLGTLVLSMLSWTHQEPVAVPTRRHLKCSWQCFLAVRDGTYFLL